MAKSATGVTSTATAPAPYHHGDLRRALLSAAAASVAANGPGPLSLRALAAESGVSHAAPVHHFKDKAGLFTALAIEGFDLLAGEFEQVWAATSTFLEVGVRYVHFALSHKGHFEVMFRADLLNGADPELARAKHRAFAMLHEPLSATGRASGRTSGPGSSPEAEELRLAALASWSIVHGLATLVLSGNLPEVDRADPDALARKVIAGRLRPKPPR